MTETKAKPQLIPDKALDKYLTQISAIIVRQASEINKVTSTDTFEIGEVLVKVLRRFPRRGFKYALENVERTLATKPKTKPTKKSTNAKSSTSAKKATSKGAKKNAKAR